MSELFQTEYGAKWFREEGATLQAKARRDLYRKIRDWEHVAISGVHSYAHAMSAAARAANWPFEYHMREMLIEVKGIEYVRSIEARKLNEKDKRDLEMLRIAREQRKSVAKLDRDIDDFFN